jgi:N-acyl-D-amino-acid deacylase
MHDIILRGGRVVDGTGNPWFHGDVAIEDGFIVSVGRIREDANIILDVEGLIVSPGFIDVHSHSDLFLLVNPYAEAKVMQGVTTEILGQDGLGEAPIRESVIEEWRKYLSGLNGDPDINWNWQSFGEYLNALEKAETSINVASLVGHGNLRLLAMGMDNRTPAPEELIEMKDLLQESMMEGALGLSTGLIYSPCVYANTVELTELCCVVSELEGIFVVHMRNEGNYLLESIDEVVSIGRKSGAPIHISHFKAGGEANWGKSKDSLSMLEEIRAEGIDVTFDQYPYTAGSTFLSSFLSPWVHEGGVDRMLERVLEPDARAKIIDEMTDRSLEGGRTTNWDRLLVTSVSSEANSEFEGLSMSAIAKARGQTEVEALIDIISEEKNAVTMASFTMDEGDVKRIMRHPLGMACTDGILLGKPHPRAYGSMPRILGRYVREGTLTLEQAVRRMTSFPAQRFKFEKRGIIKPDFHADITIFDAETVTDTATYQDSRRYPKGILHVIVNGEITVKNSEHTKVRSGHVLRHVL